MDNCFGPKFGKNTLETLCVHNIERPPEFIVLRNVRPNLIDIDEIRTSLQESFDKIGAYEARATGHERPTKTHISRTPLPTLARRPPRSRRHSAHNGLPREPGHPGP